MKKSTTIVLLAIAFALAAGTAEAKTTKKKAADASVAPTTENIETHQASASHHGDKTFQLGVSTVSPLPMFTMPSISIGGVSVSTGSTTSGSLTGILQLDNLDAIQFLVGVPSTTGGFTFGLGAMYKHTLWGNESAGIHLGGGAGLGTLAGNFAFSIAGIGGAHFNVPGTNFYFHFDGGAGLSLASISVSGGGFSASSTQTNFAIGPASGILGASVVYEL